MGDTDGGKVEDDKRDGWYQVFAGLRLLLLSGLVECVDGEGANQLKARSQEKFDDEWSERDPVIGRLAAWQTFSAGAELLAKGVCLIRGIAVRSRVDERGLWHDQTVDAWVEARFKAMNEGEAPEDENQDGWSYGTMGGLTRVPSSGKKKGGKEERGHLWELFKCGPGGFSDEAKRVIVAYELLCTRIRNRDAHAWQQDKRDADFEVIGPLLVPAFNILLGRLPDAGLPAALRTDVSGELEKWLPRVTHPPSMVGWWLPPSPERPTGD